MLRKQHHSDNDNVQEETSKHDAMFYVINSGGAVVSVSLVALISAMFLGFLTLNEMDVRIKMQAAVHPAERQAAAAVIDIVSQDFTTVECIGLRMPTPLLG